MPCYVAGRIHSDKRATFLGYTMKKRNLILAAVLVAHGASAQTLQYDAQLGPDGKISITPKGSPEGGTDSVFKSESSKVYILKNDEGAVKAIYDSQTEALQQPLQSGDTVEAVATVGYVNKAAPADTSEMRRMAEQVARDMLEQTRSVMCSMSVRPESFTTGAEVSFGILAGATLQVSATWQSASVCQK